MSTSSSSPPICELVRKTIADYRSRLGIVSCAFELECLAGACVAEAAWLSDGQRDPEVILEHCRIHGRAILKTRVDRLRAKVLKDEVRSSPAP
jgi:hypothetical protein